jgi:hemerythrin-like domain-containing protein
VEGLIGDLKKGKEIIETLNALGHLLEKHIRKEERELFELLQEKLRPEILNHIADELQS